MYKKVNLKGKKGKTHFLSFYQDVIILGGDKMKMGRSCYKRTLVETMELLDNLSNSDRTILD